MFRSIPFHNVKSLYTLGPLFCALVWEEVIFAVCKWCANEGFACMCKKNIYCFFFFFGNVFTLPSFKVLEKVFRDISVRVLRIV